MRVSVVCFSVLASFSLLGCASTPEAGASAPQTSRAPAPGDMVDLSELSAPDMNLERLVQVCQPHTDSSFTYTAEVRSLLLGARVMVRGPLRMHAKDVSPYVRGVLEANGFTVSPIGPEHVRVFQIRQRET